LYAQTTAPSASPPCWPAVDGLGRALPTPEDVGPPHPDRFVGIFYFLTHNDASPRAGASEPGPHDITKILARDPDALQHPKSPAWGAPGGEYYWGEPLYGYYLSTDPWVIRRHAQLLAAAGVDTLIFDTTNAVTYPEVYTKICEEFTEVRKAGGRTPGIAFMVNTEAGKTADQLYHDLYQPGRFRDLWFVWRGKPLLICDTAQASEPVKRFFTLRAAHWPFTLLNTPYAWHWESTYPQVYGYTEDPKVPEQVNVAVAQNLRAADGRVTNMSRGDARGRSFHDGREDRTLGAVNHGYNFAEQWRRALQLAPPFVMVTGWNEWTAGRFIGKNGTSVFVDQFDEEFSRDIEPMHGGHGDNYYYQLVANVRRYKGAVPLPKASAPRTIDLTGSFDQWRDVGPSFRDEVDDTQPREFPGASGLHYTNRSGRNDLIEMKVARDAVNVYFYARTAAPLTPRTAPHWMWLLLSTGQPGHPTWAAYDFIVNHTIDPDGTAWLEACEGGWHWKKVAKVELRVIGSELQLGIPRKLLNLPDTRAFHLDFKWADNLQHPGDVMDFYHSGDVAPEGRFMYRYTAE
ncbi:MAG TPA: hypothetical protein VGI81_04980, partial [Tepidisphaeraceae bacterium]